MRITKIKINNFKALRTVESPMSRFVCLIGENNSGKSSLLQALLLFVEGRKIAPDVFYDPTQPISISVRFEGISDDDLSVISNEEHRNRTRGILHGGSLVLVRRYEPDGTNRLRWIARIPTEKRFDQASIDDLLKGKKPSSSFASEIVAVFPEVKANIDSKTNQTRARELIEQLALTIADDQKTDQEKDLPSGLDNTIRPLLPEPIYIPAVKDLSDDVKTKESTSFGKLLGILLNEITPQLQQTEETFKVLNKWLNRVEHPDGTLSDDRLDAVKQIESAVETYVKENFQSVSLDIRIPPPEIKTVLSSAQIWANDGVLGELSSKGDGLKRAVTFAILRAYVDLKRRTSSAEVKVPTTPGYLFLFEEPELYLHPVAQRILFDALSEISVSHHVVVSTHSPLFFGPDSTGTFVKLAKKTDTTMGPKPFAESRPIDLTSLEEKAKFQLITFETTNAAFFCRTVVLVEGDSDFLVMPHLARTINEAWEADRAGLAFCRISGKGGVERYKKFFTAFGIRVCVIGDLDCLLDGFRHLGAPAACVQAREDLIRAVDEYAQIHGITGKLSSGDLKEIAESPTRRAQYRALREIGRHVLAGGATAQQWEEAESAFFGDETEKTRRAVLEDEKDDEIVTRKRALIRSLWASDIFILDRGTVEAYYPPEVTGPDKPSMALDFCSRVTTKEQVVALCDQIEVDGDGTRKPEFEVIFSKIFPCEAAPAGAHA
ncbi:MAG: ATP-dependent endonuclease [Terriglobia bacterium]